MKFELNEYNRQLTDIEIIADIRKVATSLGKDYISISIYKANGKYSQTAIQNHFGTWKNALTIAGLRSERNSAELKHIPDEEYFDDLRRVAKLINKETVPYLEYRKHGNYCPEYFFSRFNKKNWNDILKEAGLKPTGFNKEKITEQQCFDEIERMWRLLGRQPTSTDVMKLGICKYSIDTFKRRFGGWRNALKAFVKYINSSDCEYEPYSSEIKPMRKNTQKNEDKNEKVNTYKHRTTRTINARLRYKVLKRDNFKCCACGAAPSSNPSIELQIDHIIPWEKGGETEEENLQTLCSVCNQGKSNLVYD